MRGRMNHLRQIERPLQRLPLPNAVHRRASLQCELLNDVDVDIFEAIAIRPFHVQDADDWCFRLASDWNGDFALHSAFTAEKRFVAFWVFLANVRFGNDTLLFDSDSA